METIFKNIKGSLSIDSPIIAELTVLEWKYDTRQLSRSEVINQLNEQGYGNYC